MRPSSSVVAIVPAAGSGQRMGGGTSSKLLSKVAGVTVIERTVTALRSHPEIAEIVVMVRQGELPQFSQILARFEGVSVAMGGATRQDSVSLGLQHFSKEIAHAQPLVLVHDGARCLVSPHLIGQCIAAAREFRAVTAALPVIDTIAQVDKDGVLQASLDRSQLWSVQTPQVFDWDLISAAHRQGPAGATDDASLVQRLHPVRVVKGEPNNIKITHPEDLAVAEFYLQHFAASRT